MKLIQVLKMLSKADDWKYITPFECAPDLIEVTHRSGVYYNKRCYAVTLRIRNGVAYSSNPFSGLLTEFMSRRLERKLNKRLVYSPTEIKEIEG